MQSAASPTTSPRSFTSGPPLLPGLRAASIRTMKSASVIEANSRRGTCLGTARGARKGAPEMSGAKPFAVTFEPQGSCAATKARARSAAGAQRGQVLVRQTADHRGCDRVAALRQPDSLAASSNDRAARPFLVRCGTPRCASIQRYSAIGRWRTSSKSRPILTRRRTMALDGAQTREVGVSRPSSTPAVTSMAATSMICR